MEDHYKTLGVPRDSSLETIKERYRFLAHAYHPDKFSNEIHKSQAEQEFKKISKSFKILTDRKRSAFGTDEIEGVGKGNSESEPVDLKSEFARHEKSGRPARKSNSHRRFLSFLSTLHQRRVGLGFAIAVVLLCTTFVLLKNSVEAKRSSASVDRTLKVSAPIKNDDESLQSLKSQTIVTDEVKWSDEGVLADPEFIQASSFLAKSNLEQAFHSFSTVSIRFPRSQLALVKVAHTIGELYGSDHSVGPSAQAVIDNPTSADAWLCLADALNQKGCLSEALYSYRKAVEIEPRFEIGWNALGAILDGNGQTEEAVGAYRHALEINPRRPQNWNCVAIGLQKQGKVPEAIGIFKQAIEEKAANANTWNNLGVILMSEGKADEAIEAFRHSVELEPSLAKAWNNLGVGLQTKGKKDEASIAFMQANQITKN